MSNVSRRQFIELISTASAFGLMDSTNAEEPVILASEVNNRIRAAASVMYQPPADLNLEEFKRTLPSPSKLEIPQGREYYRRQLVAMAHIANYANNSTWTPAEKRNAVNTLREIILTGKDLGGEFVEGTRKLFESRSAGEQYNLEKNSNYISGGLSLAGAGIAGVEAAPSTFGASLLLTGLAVGVQTSPYWLPGKTTSDDEVLREVATAAIEQGHKIAAQYAKAGELLTDPVVKKVFNIDLSQDTAKCVDQLADSDIKKTLNNMLQEAKKTKGDIEELAKDISSKINKAGQSLADLVTNKIGKMLDKRDEDLAKKQQEQNEEIRLQKEIEGGVYLVGLLLDKVNPQLAFVIKSTYKAYSAMSSMAAMYAAGTLGPIGIAAGMASLAFSMMNEDSGLQQEMLRQIGDVHEAVIKVHNLIVEVQKQLNDRFDHVDKKLDYLVEGQRELFNRLEEVYSKLSKGQYSSTLLVRRDIELVAKKIDAFRASQEADARRDTTITYFDVAIEKLNEQLDLKREGKRINPEKVLSALKLLHAFAVEQSDRPAFNNNHVFSWDASLCRIELASMKSLEHKFGMLPAIIEGLTGERPSMSVNNPLTFAQGAQAYASARIMFPEINGAELNRPTAILLNRASSLRKTFTKVLDPETISKAKDTLLNSVDSALKELVYGTYNDFQLANHRTEEVDSKQGEQKLKENLGGVSADYYPFDLLPTNAAYQLQPGIEFGELKEYAATHVSEIKENDYFNPHSGLENLYGKFLTNQNSITPIDSAINYGLLSVKKVSRHKVGFGPEIGQIYEGEYFGKFKEIGERTQKEKDEALKEAVIKEQERNKAPQNPAAVVASKSASENAYKKSDAAAPYIAQACVLLQRPYSGVINNTTLYFLTFLEGKHKGKTFPWHEADITDNKGELGGPVHTRYLPPSNPIKPDGEDFSDTRSLIKMVNSELKEHYKGNREKLIAAIKEKIVNDGQNFESLEALARSAAYLAGLKIFGTTSDLNAATWVAQKYDAFGLGKEDITALIDQILNPKTLPAEIPMYDDPDNTRPKKLHEYLYEEVMKAVTIRITNYFDEVFTKQKGKDRLPMLDYTEMYLSTNAVKSRGR